MKKHSENNSGQNKGGFSSWIRTQPNVNKDSYF